MAGYYDALLAAVPLALVGLAGGLYAAGIGPTLALTAGGLAALALTAHGLFVNDPTDVPDQRADASYESAD
ncbi:hypothetical protein [Halobacterium sp. R2-5]|uniref:hypothetical protein n=1 Tax=Halobacterium sp. R2-5 TaxID=2715751 RepID=UPI001423A30B|nr:hypothetical protein [Halobacterium sp. R2-5]NIB99520.1 hypothetical protein [Halobacterium sp. R2-5]